MANHTFPAGGLLTSCRVRRSPAPPPVAVHVTKNKNNIPLAPDLVVVSGGLDRLCSKWSCPS